MLRNQYKYKEIFPREKGLKTPWDCFIITRREPGMFDNSDILNLQYFKRDSYISVICQASVMQWKTEKQMRLPTQRQLGVKIRKTAFRGIREICTNEKGSCESNCPILHVGKARTPLAAHVSNGAANFYLAKKHLAIPFVLGQSRVLWNNLLPYRKIFQKMR